MAAQARSPRGYHKLAGLMGLYPEAAIFRRFGSLTMLNLMKLQAELVALEDQIRRIGERDDASKNPNEASYSIDFYALNNPGADDDEAQRVLLENSRIKLEEYHSLLLKAANITALSKPKSYELAFLREWLKGEEDGDNFLSGRELERTWDKAVTRDLISLLPANSTEAPITNWFNPILVDWYHRTWGGRNKARNTDSHRDPVDNESGQVYNYDDSKFIKSTQMGFTISATIIAALLPALVILWLYHVKRTVVRIGITIGFTAGIGLFLRLCTTANMKEIFGATAAFAAVEVVFIGTANGA